MQPDVTDPPATKNRVAGTVSSDRLFYWDGGRWISTLSADGAWRWDGAAWVPASTGSRPAAGQTRSGRRLARALQILLCVWIATVFAELFLVFDYFVLTFTPADGSAVTFRWGVASTLLLVAIAIVSVWWLVRVHAEAAPVVGGSRLLQVMVAALAVLLGLYVITDVALAELVRGVAISGAKTRWEVLLSAAFGVGAAALAIDVVARITAGIAEPITSQEDHR